MSSTAVSNAKPPVAQFRDFLEKGRNQIAAALPSHLTPDRMIRLALTEFSKNPNLQKCNQTSVFGAIVQASQLGLEVGVLGQAYLVPYKDVCTLIPGYKGLIALARRSGEVSSIETHIVYDKDEFSLTLGLDSQISHKPYLDGDRGAPRLVYGVAKFKDGGHHFEWMSIDEVNKIRSRSKASNNGPWVTDYGQMVRKTLIRRMMNYLPMSIELSAALQLSDAADEGKIASFDGDFIVVEQEPETAETPTLPVYSDDDFQKNKSSWREIIIAGKKSPEQIIKTVETKAIMTEDQKLEIDSWANEQE